MGKFCLVAVFIDVLVTNQVMDESTGGFDLQFGGGWLSAYVFLFIFLGKLI